ncbi:SRPBCC family protein [Actinoplanes sp. G11-F43]|uniref:SRPBCC family protein n=1 Tax=Actinoplanes sp. G11-F43 TaxID=3424130 RepID=UPI003D33BEE0
MTGEPNGRIVKTAVGYDLVLTRTFAASPDDVWGSVTESDRTARWFGGWEGDAGVGRTIKVQMAYEDGTPWMDLRIDACEPPTRLALTSEDEAGSWRTEILLVESGGGTELSFIHHLDSTGGIGEIGPGWEYYLDMLAASRDGSPRPAFDDYHPAMKDHYEALLGTLS